MKVTEEYVFFWKGELSQWWRSPILDKSVNITFNCAEQYMMYYKAKLFNDTESMDKILLATHPKDQQLLGRSIKNFKQDIWDRNKFNIVFSGNLLKFHQNDKLKQLLMSYWNPKFIMFVEASPIDKIWGIGLDESNKDILDESKWQGQNLLGKALTNVGQTFLNRLARTAHIYGEFNDANLKRRKRYPEEIWGT